MAEAVEAGGSVVVVEAAEVVGSPTVLIGGWWLRWCSLGKQ